MTLLDSIRNLIYIKVKINYKYEHLFLYTSQDNVKTKRLEYGNYTVIFIKIHIYEHTVSQKFNILSNGKGHTHTKKYLFSIYQNNQCN